MHDLYLFYSMYDKFKELKSQGAIKALIGSTETFFLRLLEVFGVAYQEIRGQGNSLHPLSGINKTRPAQRVDSLIQGWPKKSASPGSTTTG